MSALEVSRRNRPEDVVFPPWGIAVFESHHASSFNMEMGVWPFHKLCWVAVGSGVLERPRLRAPIQRHDLIFLPAGENHRFVDVAEDPLTLVIACWNEDATRKNDLLRDLEKDFRAVFPAMKPLGIGNSYQRNLIRGILKTLLRERFAPTDESAASSHAALLDLLVNLRRFLLKAGFGKERTRHEHDLEGVLEYLDNRFDEAIQVRDLAELCGLSTRRFSTLFKARTGKTPIEYLTEKRLSYATERLRQTGHILYAALEAGFNDLPYFYRVFKRHTGKTPGTFLASIDSKPPGVGE